MAKKKTQQSEPQDLATIEAQPLAVSGAAGAVVASAQAEMLTAYMIAHQEGRNESNCYQQIIRSCKRPGLAAKARYTYSRGGQSITGPSIYLAREMARCWGHIRTGFDVLSDDEDTVTVRGWALDLATNTRFHRDDSFRKRIRRGGKDIKPDDRDLRELINKHGVIAQRNAILEIIPKDIVEDALEQADATLRAEIKEDPDAQRKKLVTGFDQMSVSVEMLEELLGHPVDNTTPDELIQLRGIYERVRDGNATFFDFLDRAESAREKEGERVDLSKLGFSERPRKNPKAEELMMRLATEAGLMPEEVDAYCEETFSKPMHKLDEEESFRLDVYLKELMEAAE